MVHELWITRIFNDYLAGPANSILNAVHFPAQDPKHPWSDWLVCEIVVVAFVLIFFGILRRRLSVDRPGKAQHIFEIAYDFFRSSSEEVVGHDGPKYLAFFGTIFLFILFLNIVGLIPGFDSPTMYPMVPLGFAVTTFLFYHYTGVRAHGPGYIKQFFGPMLLLAPLMLPIEIISHCARPLSLTVRLFANMFAGEQVYLTFITLTKLLVPVLFLGLHLFVSFLQAYIFMLLAMVYVGGAVSHEH
ncbi:MAG: F0F1 ATP synthase subunit A [Acidobacteriaceae bacterium]|nr:F0F1 ATP synthase subunit A [Acidobacteriaceae bacterium]